MVQHLLIGDLGGLLIALGLTGPLLQPLLARRPFAWLRVLGNPLVALPIWALNLYLWHLSALYDGVLTSPLLHFAQHAGFFTFGLAMWLPLVGPLPKPTWFSDAAKLGYIVVVRFLEAVLANYLIWSGTVLYPDYAPGEAKWDISPLADQGAAGNVMMIWTGTVTLGAVHLAVLPRRQPQHREAGADRARRGARRSTSTRRGRRARSPPARASACASASSAAARPDATQPLPLRPRLRRRGGQPRQPRSPRRG